MKLKINEEDKRILVEMRERLTNIKIENDGVLSRIKGGCGGHCRVTCSWWCESTCRESCYMTSMEVNGDLGNLCAHKPMDEVDPNL